MAAGVLASVLVVGCASEPGRVAGPGAMVASVGGGLVNVHDTLARTLLGDAAKPMLIAPPPTEDDPTSDSSVHAVPAAAKVSSRQAASADLRRIDPASATSADLDGDGAVSLDEVVALGRSGLDDAEVLERLERTGHTFDLSTSQEQYLRTRGISDDLIARLRTLNRAAPAPASPDMTARSIDVHDGTPLAR